MQYVIKLCKYITRYLFIYVLNKKKFVSNKKFEYKIFLISISVTTYKIKNGFISF